MIAFLWVPTYGKVREWLFTDYEQSLDDYFQSRSKEFDGSSGEFSGLIGDLIGTNRNLTQEQKDLIYTKLGGGTPEEMKAFERLFFVMAGILKIKE